MVRVSVIMPTFNCAVYIGEAIESALNQTYKDFEIVIVDDGSTDNTEEVVRRYIFSTQVMIKYIRQFNSGPAVARNKAISESRGEFLALLDADDIWLPDRLKEGLASFEANPDVGLIHSDTLRIDEKGDFLPKPRRNVRLSSGNIFNSLMLRKVHISCPTVLLRRAALDKVGLFDENPQCRGVEDRDLWLRITKEYKVFFIDKILAHYRIRKNSISRDPEKMAVSKIYVINKFYPENGVSFFRNRAIAQVCRESADDLLIRGEFVLARAYYRKAVALWPFLFWCWVNLAKTFSKGR